jgi:hypothetical protein
MSFLESCLGSILVERADQELHRHSHAAESHKCT